MCLTHVLQQAWLPRLAQLGEAATGSITRIVTPCQDFHSTRGMLPVFWQSFARRPQLEPNPPGVVASPAKWVNQAPPVPPTHQHAPRFATTKVPFDVAHSRVRGAGLAGATAQLDGSMAQPPQPAVLPPAGGGNGARAATNGSALLPDPPTRPGIDVAQTLDVRLGSGLDERILSGEFGDEGSTKERLLRPLRKLLARDRIGPGDLLICDRPLLVPGLRMRGSVAL